VNTKLVAWSSGFRILVNAILDPKLSATLQENLIFTFLYLINEPKARVYLRKFKDLDRIVSVFVEVDSGMRE
jgi:hypothetical protein